MLLKESIMLTCNWNFQRDGVREGEVQTEKPSMGGVWKFFGTTHCVNNLSLPCMLAVYISENPLHTGV